MSSRQTVSGAYAKQAAHEDLCAERYANIHTVLGELKEASGKQSTLLWGIVLSVAGFTFVTLVAVMLHALKLA